MVATLNVPFEVWHTILHDVYSDVSAFPHLEDPCYVLSPLHWRLLIHRNISLVSKHLHELSSTIFLEELRISQPEALLAVSRLVRDPNIARVIRKLWLNFYEYRCGASRPRRPREMKETDLDAPSPPDLDPIAQAAAQRKRIAERTARADRARYTASWISQSRHWQGWIGLTRTILSCCTGVSEVSIDATADYSRTLRWRRTESYHTLFARPDLDSDALLAGLLEASNLQVLRLVDPSPLDSFGAALGKWRVLREVEIVISSNYPEAKRISKAIFAPPASLRKFTLTDRSFRVSSLPTVSDLSKCKSLSSLHLGVLDLTDRATVLSAQFLISTYQHSLVDLTLDIRNGARDITTIMDHGDLHFPLLKSLVVQEGTCHASLFSTLKADALERIELLSMDTDSPAHVPGRTSRRNPHSEEYWNAFFSQLALVKLKSFHIQVIDQDTKTVMRNVATALGIDVGEDNHMY